MAYVCRSGDVCRQHLACCHCSPSDPLQAHLYAVAGAQLLRHGTHLLCRLVHSRHRRAKARVLHTAMSGPLHHTSSDGERDDEEADEESDLNDAGPQVQCHC